MAISATTFLSDTILFIRDDLDDNITDPVSTSRSGRDRFVLTSYPERPVKYPIITVKDSGVADIAGLGLQSEIHSVRVPVEIRVWARNVKERDDLFEKVYTRLRTNQFGGANASVDNQLFGFRLNSVINVDEVGVNAIKSKVMEVEYMIVTE